MPPLRSFPAGSHPTVESPRPSLTVALRQREAWVRGLLDLSREQLQWIDAEDYDRLLDAQLHKERLVAQLVAQSKGPPPLAELWSKGRDELPDAERRRCEQRIEAIEAGLRTLAQEDAVGMTALQARIDSARIELRSVAEKLTSHQRHLALDRRSDRSLIDFET